MKVCRKCNNEYKDAYSFCPKCGKPFDDSIKVPKIPGVPRTDGLRILSLIWNIILYIIGSIFILVFLFSIPEAPIGSIFGILFGLSLFQVFYKIIEDKTNIPRVLLIIARLVLPFILLIATGLGLPTEPVKDNKQNIKIEEKMNQQDNSNKNINQNDSNNKSSSESINKEDDSQKQEPTYMEYLRKCTVMEAADIYNTGTGKEGVSNFYTAKNTCEMWYKQFGEKEFINIVETDWNERQNEHIGAQPLTHYLDTLGW